MTARIQLQIMECAAVYFFKLATLLLVISYNIWYILVKMKRLTASLLEDAYVSSRILRSSL